MEQVLTIIFLLIGIAVGIVALVKAIPRRWRRRRSSYTEIELMELRSEVNAIRTDMHVQLLDMKRRIKKLKREKAFPTPHKTTNDEKPPFIPVPHNSPERL